MRVIKLQFATLFNARNKNKKVLCIRIWSIKMTKTIHRCNTKKMIEAEKMETKTEKLMKNTALDYLKWTWKPSLIIKQIFDNILVVIHNMKTTLALHKPAYIRICILELSKVLMYEFYYDYVIKNMATNRDYYSQILTA